MGNGDGGDSAELVVFNPLAHDVTMGLENCTNAALYVCVYRCLRVCSCACELRAVSTALLFELDSSLTAVVYRLARELRRVTVRTYYGSTHMRTSMILAARANPE